MQGRHLGSEDRENFDGDGLSFEPGEVLANFPAGLTAPFLWIRSRCPASRRVATADRVDAAALPAPIEAAAALRGEAVDDALDAAVAAAATAAGTGRHHHLDHRRRDPFVHDMPHGRFRHSRAVAERPALGLGGGEAAGRHGRGGRRVHAEDQSPPPSPMCWAR